MRRAGPGGQRCQVARPGSPVCRARAASSGALGQLAAHAQSHHWAPAVRSPGITAPRRGAPRPCFRDVLPFSTPVSARDQATVKEVCDRGARQGRTRDRPRRAHRARWRTVAERTTVATTAPERNPLGGARLSSASREHRPRPKLSSSLEADHLLSRVLLGVLRRDRRRGGLWAASRQSGAASWIRSSSRLRADSDSSRCAQLCSARSSTARGL